MRVCGEGGIIPPSSLLPFCSMSGNLQDFTARYAEMGEEELMNLARAYDSLTDSAQTALREEFKHRGLEPPLIDDVSESPAQRRLTTVGRYRDLTEADVARSVLESAGIHTYMWNQNLVRVDWPVSNAIGGVQLQVDLVDEPAAIELLTQAAPNSIRFGNGEQFTQPVCPTCGSSDISSSQFFGVAEPVPPGRDIWRCNACGKCWEETED
jgi:hypothetical protein